jgi:hypothetical protein
MSYHSCTTQKEIFKLSQPFRFVWLDITLIYSSILTIHPSNHYLNDFLFFMHYASQFMIYFWIAWNYEKLKAKKSFVNQKVLV